MSLVHRDRRRRHRADRRPRGDGGDDRRRRKRRPTPSYRSSDSSSSRERTRRRTRRKSDAAGPALTSPASATARRRLTAGRTSARRPKGPGEKRKKAARDKRHFENINQLLNIDFRPPFLQTIKGCADYTIEAVTTEKQREGTWARTSSNTTASPGRHCSRPNQTTGPPSYTWPGNCDFPWPTPKNPTRTCPAGGTSSSKISQWTIIASPDR